MDSTDPAPLILGIFLLVTAALLLAINLKIYTNEFAKALSWYSMWACIIAAVVVMVRGYGV